MSYFERGDNNHSAVINSPAPTNYTIRDSGRVPYSIDGVPTTQFINYDPKYYRKDNWLENTDKNINYVTTFGNSTPLRNEEIGYKTPATTLLPLHWNTVSPECCPSTFSTSMGCVCTSNKQRDLIGMYRGGNKTHYDDEF
jgi:hypothetical protein